MELLPKSPDQPKWLPRIYYASSITDLVSSDEQVVRDYEASIKPENPSRFDRAGDVIFQAIDRAHHRVTGRGLPLEASTFVYLPLVRHDPRQDATDNNNVITVSDPTGSCELSIPTVPIEIFLRSAGMNLSKEALKDGLWASALLLFESVNLHSERSNRWIIDVRNHHVKQRRPKEIVSFIQKASRSNKIPQLT